MIAREESLLQNIRHENIVNLYASFTFRGSRYMCLQYCKEGDLFSVIQRHDGKLDFASAQFCTAEIVNALQYLHRRCSIVYADLKPENVMITDTGHVMLGDFGAARQVVSTTTTTSTSSSCRLEGTTIFNAPTFSKSREHETAYNTTILYQTKVRLRI